MYEISEMSGHIIITFRLCHLVKAVRHAFFCFGFYHIYQKYL